MTTLPDRIAAATENERELFEEAREAFAQAMFSVDREDWMERRPDDNFNTWDENCEAFKDEYRHKADRLLAAILATQEQAK